MNDRRVYDAAKELNLSSEALVHLLRELDFKVRGYMSVVTPEMLKKVKKKLEEDKRRIKEKDREKEKLRRGKKRKVERRLRKPEEKKRAAIKVKETLAKIKTGEQKPKKREKVERVETKSEKEVRKIQLPELVSVEELAKLLSASSLSLIAKCLELGLMVTINRRLDYETASMIASEYGHDTELISYYEEVAEGKEEVEEIERAPVVTVMGHVDHGKTTLLDYIRKTNVIAKEKGGITQHIGASIIAYKDKKITFLDTPGHEAFTAMRARGAQITDIILIVVAADDGVMPQTVEALDHARDANVPIIVAINKIDLEGARPDMVKQQLAQHNLLLEEIGGDVPAVMVSAKTGVGIDDLLDSLLLIAEMKELKAPLKGNARGYIIEARLDRYKGTVATVLITKGQLKKGNSFVAGTTYGKVRAMYDEFNRAIEEAAPSMPVMVLGFEHIPKVGDRFVVLEDRTAREIARKRQLAKREMIARPPVVRTLQSIQDKIQKGETKELKVIIKGDVGGSVEAMSDSLRELSTEETKITVVHSGVGDITESDVLLASVSDSIIVGYHAGTPSSVKMTAKREGVEIRVYDVIYKALEDIKLALVGLLEPTYEEKLIGEAEIRQIFNIPKIGKIAGCYVKDGKVVKNAPVKIVRDSDVVGEGKIISLRRTKNTVNEVSAGFECGIGFEEIDDFVVGDIVQVYEMVEKKREV
ncbi:MAG: translation initiation factor IF-2 [candidate division WOR-3 bacterium]|nr:translation initiation factor IF-2 [candidate division WOR-3 bacterium]